jgi:hypothetical protein
VSKTQIGVFGKNQVGDRVKQRGKRDGLQRQIMRPF